MGEMLEEDVAASVNENESAGSGAGFDCDLKGADEINPMAGFGLD